MKRICNKITAILVGVLFLAGCLKTVPASAEQVQLSWPAGPAVEAPSAIVMEAATGTVLYEKDADATHYPASITKILTTLLALENGSMDETVTFSEDAVYKNEGDTSHIARDIGEEMTLEQCLYAVMLESANECAYAVAEHIGGGDYQKFVDMMNERAAALGCTNTHFTNSNGLPDEAHVTTCRDMALISRAAIQNSEFRQIAGTLSYEIPPTNKHAEPTPLNNHHQMISTYKGGGNLYEYCIGGKTGYTEAAGNTLVTFAEKDGMTLICVVMACPSGTHYRDTRTLFDYCFDNFKAYNILQNETRYDRVEGDDLSMFTSGEAFAELDSDASVILPVSAEFNDTKVQVSYGDVSGQTVGTLVYTYGDHTVGSAQVVMTGAEVTPYEFDESTGGAEEDSKSAAESALDILKLHGRENTVKFVIKIAIVAGIAVVAFLIIIYLYNNLYRIWRRRRRQKRRYKTIKGNRKWNRRGGSWR